MHRIFSIVNMVSTRLFFPQSQTVSLSSDLSQWTGLKIFSIKSHEARLRSRLYPSASSSPCHVSVVARQTCPSSVHTRLPFPENYLGKLQLQPYIHNCAATIHEGRHTHRFMIFYKRHCRLQANQCLSTMVQGPTNIQGDVIIMRVGSKATYVNLRSGDAKRSDWLMRRWVLSLCIDQMTLFFNSFCRSPLLLRRRLPSKVEYRKF
jgi:hypothetical protein